MNEQVYVIEHGANDSPNPRSAPIHEFANSNSIKQNEKNKALKLSPPFCLINPNMVTNAASNSQN